MSQINFNSTSGASDVTFNSCVTGQRSPQLALAMLEMELAKANKIKPVLCTLVESETAAANRCGS